LALVCGPYLCWLADDPTDNVVSRPGPTMRLLFWILVMTTPTSLNLSLLQTSVEAMATVAFALSGLLEAARKRLDVVGVFVVAGLAAFGGGTLRDILLDRRPLF